MPCLFLKFWLGVHHFSFKLNGGCAKPPERWQGWSGFYSPGMEDQDAHQPNEVVSLWTTDSDDRVIMSSEGQTTTLFIFRIWKLNMKVMQIHYHCAAITSIGTSSMDGLLRDNGWVLHTWRHFILLVFHSRIPQIFVWGFSCVPFTGSQCFIITKILLGDQSLPQA